MNRSVSLKCLVVLVCMVNSLWAKPFMGQYKGTFYPDNKVTMDATATVVDEGDGDYRINIHAISDDPKLEGAHIEIMGREFGPQVHLSSRAGGYDWRGEIQNGRLAARSQYGQHFELEKIESKSPRAGAKPPEGAVILLPYKAGTKPDLSGWTNSEWKARDNGSMESAKGKGANKTRREFSDIKQLHVEFKLPLEPHGRGQHRANSGVYVIDAYEVQVLDSFGLVHTSGDCGGLYDLARAKINACLPPQTWQTYDITFRAPRLDENGNVKELPQITVIFNGVKIHDRQEIPKRRHRTRGPIQLQDHGHNIQFRNIWLVEGQ
ncbi:MAG: 3-keto-disaccharide hydrolase [Planctomycetota bacterium]